MSERTQRLRIGIYVLLFAAAAVIGVFQFREHQRQHGPLPNFGQVPDFILSTEDSIPFTRNHLRGRITVADFIFTSCAGPCQAEGARRSRFVLHEEVDKGTLRAIYSQALRYIPEIDLRNHFYTD